MNLLETICKLRPAEFCDSVRAEFCAEFTVDGVSAAQNLQIGPHSHRICKFYILPLTLCVIYTIPQFSPRLLAIIILFTVFGTLK